MATSPVITDSSASVSPTQAAPTVLAIGPWQQTEFAIATSGLQLPQHWQTATNITDATEILSGNRLPPELILLAQPLPDTYRQADIDRLQRLAPLSRLVVVAGTWCEGETRTGNPPIGVLRLYWYEFAPWWQAALRQLDTGLCPLWSLPFDHPLAGRCSTEKQNFPSATTKQSILIDTPDYAVYETLASALEPHGIAQRWQTGGNTTANAGIWDGGQLSVQELTRLTNFCQQIEGSVVALLDFPRAEHLHQAQAAGATTVLAKPYVVEELLAALTQKESPSLIGRG